MTSSNQAMLNPQLRKGEALSRWSNKRSIPLTSISVLTLLGLVLLLTLGDTGSAASEAAASSTPRNLNVSPGAGGELVSSWEAPASDGDSEVAAYKVQWKKAADSWDALAESTAAPGPAQEAVPRPVSAQFVGPKDDSDEGEVYTWHDGDRIMRLRLLPGTAQQNPTGPATAKGAVSQQQVGSDPGPIFRPEGGGELMTLPGGVLLVLDSSWTASDSDGFFSRNGIEQDRVAALDFTENAYLVETDPGFPSLRLANALAVQEGVEISSPNWKLELAAVQSPPQANPGDSLATALDLPPNTRMNATLSEPGDVHFYKVELTESILVSITDVDSNNVRHSPRVEFTLLDSGGVELPGKTAEKTLGLKRLAAGVYYVKVAPLPIGFFLTSAEQYSIEVTTIPDHADTSESATALTVSPSLEDMNLEYEAHGDFHAAEDVDFFKVALSAETQFVIGVDLASTFADPDYGDLTPVSVDAFDDAGNRLHPPIPGVAEDGHRSYSLDAGTYYFRLSPYAGAWEAGEHTYYRVFLFEDTQYIEFTEACAEIETSYDDPLLGCQEHLISSEAGGFDINVEQVWATNTGEGINVAVIDRDVDGDHEDLRANNSETLSYDYTNGKLVNPRVYHGTSVAGIIAARDNGLGVRGVAPRATINAYNLLEDPTLVNWTDALTRNRAVTAVSNNSYGLLSYAAPVQVSQAWEAALESGISQGFGGKGIFYVFAAGNGHRYGDHVNLRESVNFYAQTPVCVVDSDGERLSYSETGYALWICAPLARMTTEDRNRYRDDFNGTSSAAPVVSGVAALVRSANPNLTWRDVKLILAASARKTDPSNSLWEEGALRYGSATDRYSYNPEYGFGLVDAKAAVDLAKSWVNLPVMESVSTESEYMEAQQVADPADGPGPIQFVSQLTLGSDVGFTEFVEVHIDMLHRGFRDLEIEIRSPTGTVSKLAVPNERRRHGSSRIRFTWLNGNFRFGSARHLGEDPTGVWTLRVNDSIAGLGGFIRGWSIKVYGHGDGAAGSPLPNSPATGAPAISGTLQVGETLSADLLGIGDWDGLSAATFSYQWIRNDGSTDTDIQDARDSTYTLGADDEGKSIKVKVTFTDDAGNQETLTSAATSAVAGPPVPEIPANAPEVLSAPDTPIPSAQTAVHNGTVVLDWSDVPGAASYEVQLWRSTWFDVPGNGIEITFWGPGAIVHGLDREFLYYFRVRAHNALGSSDWSAPFFIPATDAALGSFDDVPEPANSAATGAPTISRAAPEQYILAASVLDIEDENGLDRVRFHYQWISSDGTIDRIIEGATDATYLPRGDDWDSSIKVRLTFTDRGGYQETLTSAAFDVADLDSTASGICDRTDMVKLAILDQLADIDDCSQVTGPHLRSITSLHLNDLGSDGLQAGDFLHLRNLKVLDLSSNYSSLTELPDGVFDNLINLEELNLGYNGLTGLPDGVFDNLVNLEDLYLHNNNLNELPDGVFDNLANLEDLNLQKNNLNELPDGVFDSLINLEDLTWSYNGLTGLPDGVFDNLSDLKFLHLHNNSLTGLPGGIFDNLIKLHILHLDQNRLTELPEGVFDNLSKLWDLSLKNNNLSELPNAFGNLSELGSLNLAGNPGAPFTFTAKLERTSDAALVVRVPSGAPYPISVVLHAQGGALSAYRVEVPLGDTVSQMVDVTRDGDGPVTVSVVLAAFRHSKHTFSIPPYTGIQTSLGDPLTLPGGVVPNTAAAGLPIIRGTPLLGQTLAADTSAITDANGLSGATFTYTWWRTSGTLQTVVKSSSSDTTYSLQAEDVGKTVSVVVTFADDAGYGESLTSASTEAVVGANSPDNSPATGLPAISGKVQVDETLTADASTTTGVGVSVGVTTAVTTTGVGVSVGVTTAVTTTGVGVSVGVTTAVTTTGVGVGVDTGVGEGLSHAATTNSAAAINAVTVSNLCRKGMERLYE